MQSTLINCSEDFIPIIRNWQKNLHNINRAKNTIIAYENDLYNFFAFYIDYSSKLIDINAFITLDLQAIRSWLAKLKKQGLNAKSLKRGLSALKNFANYMIENNYCKDHAIFLAKSPKIEKTLPKPITKEQALELCNDFDKFIQNEKQPIWVLLRDKAIVMLLYSTGIRINEALGIKHHEINLHDSFVKILGKGNKERFVPILTNVKNAIVEYKNQCPFIFEQNSFLFLGQKGKKMQAAILQKKLREYRQFNFLSNSLTPHALRHSCATHLMQQTNDLRAIQELLGHSSLSSTQIYTELDLSKLIDTHKTFHPRFKK